MKTLHRIGALGVLMVLAACSGEQLTTGGTSDAPLLNSDLAKESADAAAEDVELMGGPAGTLGFGFAAPAFAPLVTWSCESRQRDGLTVTRSCVFKDADGNVQQQYDRNTTASVEITVHVTGTENRGNWEATVDRERHLVVSGLTGIETTRTWNGTGNGVVSRSRHTDGGSERTYDITYTTTITNVVVPVPRTDHGWPISGTITRHAIVHITGGPRDGQTVERDITITFNGSNTATATIGTDHFTIDLETRTVASAS
jgi:hypothetical protein